jgi:hypothetical protein
MLGSTHPGERANAADALQRALARGGLDIHDIADAALSGITAKEPVRFDPPPRHCWEQDPPEWRAIARWLRDRDGLTERERDFVDNMRIATHASEKQLAWLIGIQQRLQREGAR